MTRWKLVIEYDGGPFVGWQRQSNGESVQAALEDAVYRFTQEECLVQGAGRTDSGVHAFGQVAHVDIENRRMRTPFETQLISISSRRLSLFNRRKRSVKSFMRASLRRSALISFEFWIDARRPPWRRDGFGMCRCRLMPMRCTRPHSRCLAITTSRVFGQRTARPTPRCEPSTGSMSGALAAKFISMSKHGPSCHQVRNFAGTLKLVGEGKWQRRDVGSGAGRPRSGRGGRQRPRRAYFSSLLPCSRPWRRRCSNAVDGFPAEFDKDERSWPRRLRHDAELKPSRVYE